MKGMVPLADSTNITDQAVMIPEPSALEVPDDLYGSIGFRGLVAQQQNRADRLLDRVAEVVADASLGKGMKNGLKKETRYVVDMSDSLIKAIDEGKIKLDYSKSGEIFAQIREASGHYGDKLPIKKELIAAGVDPFSVANALQMKAIEHKLNDMITTLEDIGQDVATVIQGQQNDRIGLYNSGKNLYLESKNVQNEQFQMLIAAQALKSLSDGSEQILQELRSDVYYLLEGKYKQKKGRSAEDIREHMTSINRCFDLIHRSFLLKAGIYYERGEVQAMLSTMDEYGNFLKSEIIPVAARLSEFDRTDILLQGGRWEKRAQMLTEIGTIRKQLSETSVYYIGLEGATHEER